MTRVSCGGCCPAGKPGRVVSADRVGGSGLRQGHSPIDYVVPAGRWPACSQGRFNEFLSINSYYMDAVANMDI